MSKVIEAIEAYGDTQVEYHQHHCQASSLSLAAAQFDLFRMKQYLVDSEQYEAAKDVDRLLQAIHDTIIYNQNNESK